MSARVRADGSQKEAVGRRFAQNALALRRRAGFSQDEAGERSDLHRTQISLLERGLRVPQLDTILQLAGGIEAEPCELVEGMAWDLDRSRPWGPEKRGVLKVKIGQRWKEV